MSAYITSIGTANPEHQVSQGDVLAFMVKAHQLNPQEADHLKLLYRATGIHSRYTVLEDYLRKEGFTFYPNSENMEPFPNTEERGGQFMLAACDLSVAAVRDCLPEDFDMHTITHLIVVSCTGMYAPGLDIDLIYQLGLNKTIERTGINFMGCYAAFNALKTANAICLSQPGSKVLIVCTELCSIHFQKEKTDDNLLANALFGDGSAAVLVESEPGEKTAFKINGFMCDLLPDGQDEMAWKIGNFGFEMKLSSYVPGIIKDGIQQLLVRLRDSYQNLDFHHYIIHPGGKKILQVIEEQLDITKEQNQSAHHVLRHFGNMSSPTVLFVLKELSGRIVASDDEKSILGLAFGPGLTLESMTLEVAYK
ncbi:type III polyketide synthase [Fulvivirga sp. M361]|uniref:type III polyketide synthase n=1 Tax=Fulvivirga sp. M361 TaxID=2594266 RepID=UPI00117A0584|nr:type III polyketide synthase [Fulvivirga sp. M361]TRX62706.1 type III polyketide synthase [Fulvivirga sp. M361]